ncbi:unnamed protein product [Parnassius apollo]|uniref:(apollo) hypothetical protein n=1 Tax=Parnassius apollo TaxID=110799 RepID=A0A8S3XLE3_PARAO|nr:unnamed protein product [Parnassius apollo]
MNASTIHTQAMNGSTAAVNLDVSDCEDFDEDDDDMNEFSQDHQIFVEMISRNPESEWKESDDEPLFNSISRDYQRRAIDRPLTWNRSENFNNTFDADPPLKSAHLKSTLTFKFL